MSKQKTYWAPQGYNYDSKGNLIAFSKNKSRNQYFAPKGFYFNKNGNLKKSKKIPALLRLELKLLK